MSLLEHRPGARRPSFSSRRAGATWRWLGAGALCLSVWTAGCEGPEPGAQATEAWVALAPLPSPEVFATQAVPLLERRCADGGCHGDGERFFSLYARGRRRLDPAETFRPTPLTPAELSADYDAALGFLDAPEAEATTLFRKALGELAHGGGVVFSHRADPEAQLLARALRSGGAP